MSEDTLIGIFTVIFAWNVILSGSLFGLIIAHVKMRVAVDLFIDSLGEKMAKALHADDDHLGIDKYLDLYVKDQEDMTHDQWFELKNICNFTLQNKEATPLERTLAGIIASICEHKLRTKFKVKPENV